MQSAEQQIKHFLTCNLFIFSQGSSVRVSGCHSCATLLLLLFDSQEKKADKESYSTVQYWYKPPLLVHCRRYWYRGVTVIMPGWVIWKYWNCPCKFFSLGSWLVFALPHPIGEKDTIPLLTETLIQSHQYSSNAFKLQAHIFFFLRQVSLGYLTVAFILYNNDDI